MPAMMAPGAMELRDLIAAARRMGCKLKKRPAVLWSGEYGNLYVPEYLEVNGMRVQLPPTNDHDVVVGPEVVEYVWTRLGLDPDSTVEH